MRLLIGNPNRTAEITALMVAAARGVAAPGTEVVGATARFGAAVIASRAEAAIAEHACLSMLAGAAPGCDAVIVGASLDTAVRAARSVLTVPVLGLTESALHVACLVGGRFGVIATSAHAVAITREMVAGYGLLSRLAGLRGLDAGAEAVLGDPAGFARRIGGVAASLVAEDGAEAIVLIGAVMAGMPSRVAAEVPVLEGVSCAVGLAEGLVRLGLPKAQAGTYAAPRGRVTAGLDGGLAALLGRDG